MRDAPSTLGFSRRAERKTPSVAAAFGATRIFAERPTYGVCELRTHAPPQKQPLLNHPIGANERRRRDGEAEAFRGPEIDTF
jgi:hypothetical protein